MFPHQLLEETQNDRNKLKTHITYKKESNGISQERPNRRENQRSSINHLQSLVRKHKKVSLAVANALDFPCDKESIAIWL